MKRRILALILGISLLLCACTAEIATKKQYQATFLNLFDTVTTIVGMASSEAAFTDQAQAIHDRLQHYHRLLDIYDTYDGIANLKTVNDQAGIAPVTVDAEIIEFLLDCRTYYDLTAGCVDVTMGSVLSLWHDARERALADPTSASLPDAQVLYQAAEHTGWENIEIDTEACTVYLKDGAQSLDVGAVAKGWATQRVAEALPNGYLLSVGGNVCATGAKDDALTPWVVGINDPDGGSDYLHTLRITRGSVVTSGDYQRFFTLDGVRYHHIIDPQTLAPALYWRSVSIICADSGLADALSTALFVLPQEQGQALLTACDAEAMWVDVDGNFYYSTNFASYIRT